MESILRPLIKALTALAADNADNEHKRLILQAWQGGRLRLAKDKGAAISGTSIDIGRDNRGAVIVGHGNIVLSESSAIASVLLQLIRAERPQSLYQLPPEEMNFHGRSNEEQDLLAALQPGETAAICALNGMGGIGKSALAARFESSDLTPVGSANRRKTS